MRSKKLILMSLILTLFLITSCNQVTEEKRSDICTKQGTDFEMTLEQAKEIASKSECRLGNLTGQNTCNEITGTWWLDLDTKKQGCNPACLINVETNEVEINWRCTGLSQDAKQNNMEVISTEIEQGQEIPKEYTCDGDNINPPIEFGNFPEDSESIVLIVDDPDAPSGTFTHWIVFNMAPSVYIAEDSVQGNLGRNDFGEIHYRGPCPPSGTHRYFFRAYALDTRLELNQGASRQEVENAMQNHILRQGELIATYSRN